MRTHHMAEKKEGQHPEPEPNETILEYSIRISGDKRTPEQIKEDSEKPGTLPPIKKTPEKKE